MTHTTLISTSQLSEHLQDPDWAIVDCRFVLTAPERGEINYARSHIPGAVYAHLDHDLSNPIIPGVTGRHPWPSVEKACDTFSRLGIDPTCQVVVYDDAGGALAAVRVWWMLRWLGHNAVAVLDGGWQRWVNEERPVRGGVESRERRSFVAQQVRPEIFVSADEIDAMRHDPSHRVFDVRAAERYRGENETIDPIAGHIPGAYSAPYLENLDEDGGFHSPQELHAHYQQLRGDTPAEGCVFYCGSGVTSIHSLLAMLHAGLGEGRLYAGSWSEWIAPRTRPVATGAERE
jgi:thiosulfate/3-mercaptopyruvate sulfurtransferase